ncbi:MAG: methyltransferase domain-containing protein [Thermodesulfobacteriota bacterium]|nr:methyltransferase domain-containing protein [Thermodesulfobacteriota bacterium]
MKRFFQRLLKEIEYITTKEWTLNDTGNFWDSIADYDDINEKTYSYSRRFVDGYRLCSIPDNSYILDICARTGNGTKFFYEKGKVRKSVCADVSSVFQNICSSNLRKYNIPFETLLFKKYRLPFTEREFDAIICFETVEHFSKPAIFINELYRLLKPGGEMLLTTPNFLWGPIHWMAAVFNFHHSEGPHRFLRRKNLVSIIIDAGFKIIKEASTVIIPGGPQSIIRFGEYLEKKLPFYFISLLALRRILICQK